MGWISPFLFLGVLVNTFTWAYVIAQRKSSDVNRSYLQFAGGTIAWLACDFLSEWPLGGLFTEIVDALNSVVWQPIGFLFLKFACTFVGRRRDPLLVASGIAAVIAIILTRSTTGLVYTGHIVTWWGKTEANGPLFVPIAMTVVVLPCCYAVWLFWRKSRAPDALPHEKRQLRLVVRGAALTILTGVFTDVVMGNIPGFEGAVPDLAASLTVIVNLHVYSAVRNHNLMAITSDKVAAKLLENATEGAVVVDHTGDVLMMNESARELLGVSDGRPPGRFESLLPEYPRESNGLAHEVAVTRGGRTRFLSVSHSVMAEEGVELGGLVLLRDVTERREAEDKLRRAAAELERANERLAREIDEKNDFLRVVSHDLGAPLRNIVGLADSIVRRHGQALGEEVADRLSRIRKNAEAETALIGELLELSRIRTRRGSIGEADIGELVREAAGNLSSDLETKKIGLELSPSWPRLVCEKARIAQVFQNLVDNAAKYMHRAEGGVIEVGWREERERYVFWVRDNGPGMNDEDKANLFKVFRRGRAAAESGVAGKGVGLAAVKAIVELHGGEVWAESEPGRGSTFYFSIAKPKAGGALQVAEPAAKSAGESWAQIDAALIRAKLAEEGL